MAGMNDKTSTPSEVLTSKEEGSVLNADDLKLAEMGYKPVLLFCVCDLWCRNFLEGFQ